jgi:hypothetical protein
MPGRDLAGRSHRCRGSDFDIGQAACGATAIHNSGTHTGGDIFGEFIDLVATVHVNGFPGGIDDDFAVMAGADVLFDLGHERRIDLPVEVVGEFGQKIGAVHLLSLMTSLFPLWTSESTG